MSEFPPDPRSPLLIDRFSHVLEQLSERRRAALQVHGSLEGVTWNVFRSLGQIDPALWLPPLMRRAVSRGLKFNSRELESLRVSLWEPVAPPPSRQEDLRRRALRGRLNPPAGRLRRGRVTPLSALRRQLAEKAREGLPLEPPLEIGALLRTRRRVVYFLPLLESEFEMEVACDRGRDAILRALDAGAYEAELGRRKPRRFYLVLLYRDERITPASVELLRRYRERPGLLARALSHRRGLDAGAAARGLGLLRWGDLVRVLARTLGSGGLDPVQVSLVERVTAWLRELGLAQGQKSAPVPARR